MVKVGDAGRRDGFDEAQAHLLGQCLEEGLAAAEQDRHPVEDAGEVGPPVLYRHHACGEA